MSDLSPEVRKAAQKAGYEAAYNEFERTHELYADPRFTNAAIDAATPIILASHPLVALWREWVEAYKAQAALTDEPLPVSANWPERYEATMKRYGAAWNALLNYRSDT